MAKALGIDKTVDILLKSHGIPNQKKTRNFIRDAFLREMSKPPRIAIIGRAGVGKSSTINALFGTKLPVSASEPGTKEPTEVQISLEGELIKGGRGYLILYDMPGIGEDIDNQETYLRDYGNIISISDVAVWVLPAGDRNIAQDQWALRELTNSVDPALASKLVIGINRADLIDPNNWNKKLNLPSRLQEQNLVDHLRYIKSKILRICPGILNDRFIVYSAKRRYRLTQLFGAMLDACPDNRAWVLNSREQLADFWEFVPRELLKQIEMAYEGG